MKSVRGANYLSKIFNLSCGDPESRAPLKIYSGFMYCGKLNLSDQDSLSDQDCLNKRSCELPVSIMKSPHKRILNDQKQSKEF